MRLILLTFVECASGLTADPGRTAELEGVNDSRFVIGSVGIGVALLNQRRQLNAQMFIEFSGRFQNILRLFPTEAWLANRTLSASATS